MRVYIPPLIDVHFSRAVVRDIFGSMAVQDLSRYLDKSLAQNMMVFSKPIKNLSMDGFEMYGIEKLFKHELKDVKFPMTIQKLSPETGPQSISLGGIYIDGNQTNSYEIKDLLTEVNDVDEDDELFKTHDRVIFDVQNYSMTFLDEAVANISRTAKFKNVTVKNLFFGDRYKAE